MIAQLLPYVLFAIAGYFLGVALARWQDAKEYERELKRVRIKDALARVSWRTTQTIQSAAADGPPGSWWVVDPPHVW